MKFLTDEFLAHGDLFALAWDWDPRKWCLRWRGCGFELGPLYVRIGRL